MLTEGGERDGVRGDGGTETAAPSRGEVGLNLWVDLSSSGFPISALLLTSIAVAMFNKARYCYN